MIRSIGATVLIVDDLEKCMMFYRDTLGLQVAFSDANSYAFRMEGQDFLLLKKEAAADEISPEAIAVQGTGRRVMLCSGVEDADTTYNELTSKGVRFIKPPTSQPWGRRTATFPDPEGNIWEIYQILEPEQK